ncbi:AHH domain-containing protein [Microcoleus sp. N3A4]|uniref:AHH domain-containing protein n=1 Tax=Microcoleus sp. N3A4 TaxID=3055379 RepID=UPI002FD73E1F
MMMKWKLSSFFFSNYSLVNWGNLMGIGQWTRKSILPGSVFCIQYNIKPGEYLIMYDGSTGELIIKEATQGKIVCRKPLNSPVDLVYLLPDREKSELMQQLKNKNYPSAGGGFCNHHVIPHFICNESELVLAAEKYNRFNKDGNDNLMPLPKNFHQKHHARGSKYCQTISYLLRDRWNALTEAHLDTDPNEIEEALKSLVDAIKAELSDVRDWGGAMNDIYYLNGM